MNELLLAIDAGTGSVRAVLFDADGRQVAIGQREYAHAAEPGVPGSQVFDTAANWQLACACIAEAIDRAAVDASAIRAVATTSMREGMVLYDSGGREIWACPNVDSRAGDEAAELVESGAAEEIYARAGDWVAITAPARLRWIARNRPEVFAVDPSHRDARRLARHPPLRRVRHRRLAWLELGHVRPGRPHVVGDDPRDRRARGRRRCRRCSSPAR